MKEFREDKKQIEKEILELIKKFEQKYNCYIDDVTLIHNGGRLINGELNAYTVTYNIYLSYKLND